MMPPAQLQRLLQEAVGHHRAGRLDRAEILYRRVRAAAPRNFDAVHLSGVIALQQGRAADAAQLLARALQISPKSAVCAMRLGLALNALGRTADAEGHLRLAVELDPSFVEGWDNLAYCLKTQNKLPAAIECHLRSVTAKPEHAAGWYNYGLTLSLAGRVAEALQCHERSLAADPAYALGHYGRAQALQQSHRMPEAIAAYDRFLQSEPDHHEARSYRLFALNYVDSLSREQLFEEHLAFGRRLAAAPVPQFPNSRDETRRLRVAILSPDLHLHSCAYFIEPLLRQMDRGEFELYLYHDHFREDAVSQRLQGLATVWRSLVSLPGPEVARQIRADQPDILIDLAGHTGMTNRLPLFAPQLAPVQITYLGYPNTTGVPTMHYRFTDAIADPPGEADRFATEKLVRFSSTAWAYQPPADAPAVNEAPGRAAGGAVTFGCFNNPGKITDPLLAMWAAILQAVPGARLALKGRGLGDPAVRQRYLSRFADRGLPADRIDLLDRTADTNDHLALYHRVDIALDTFPYNGTTTTCEALWMGVPVVTLRGDRHAARVSASLLASVGRPDWIADTPEEYVNLAVGLARDPARLGFIRAGLRDALLASPLLDHAGQARLFGAALRSCWRDWCHSQAMASAPATAVLSRS